MAYFLNGKSMVDWPYNLVEIKILDYEIGRDPDVRRTPFEDGAIAQHRKIRPLFQGKEIQDRRYYGQSAIIR